MKRFLVVLTAGLLTSLAAVAQPAPTATCKDGTTYSGASKQGACSGHGGVKEWAAKPAATQTAASAPMPAAAAPATPTAPPAKASAPATTTPAPAATPAPKKTAATPAPGGGPGQVWVNKSSKTYHCSGSKWYGTTKNGEYMPEAQAKSQGFHADHGKACS